MQRLLKAERVASPTPRSIQYVRFLNDFGVAKFSNVWTDTQTGAFTDDKVYVVQTNAKVIERCIRSEEHTSELQTLMRISYAVFCLKKKTIRTTCYNKSRTRQRRHITNTTR